jgi:hypothetical protein
MRGEMVMVMMDEVVDSMAAVRVSVEMRSDLWRRNDVFLVFSLSNTMGEFTINTLFD